jgi:molybdopterin converting factor subunit 1
MKVKVLYFAQAREAAGRASETVELETQVTASQLLERLILSRPKLAPLSRSLRISVNKEVVDGDVLLRNGDEVGILPPVAGG